MPTEKAIRIANAFTKYAKTGDKFLINEFSLEDIETTLLQYHLDRGWAHYIAMERRVEELKEINRSKKEGDMSITIDQLKKLTAKQLFQKLSVGAWVKIIIILFGCLSFSYKFGYDKGYKTAYQKSQHNNLESALNNLTGKQELLLREIWKYQKTNNLTKVIINRNGYVFDEVKAKDTTINLAEKVLGDRRSELQFDKLITNIPEDFLKMIPETRWGSPFIVTISEKGKQILDKELK